MFLCMCRYLLTEQSRLRSVNDIMPMIGARFYTQLDASQMRNDVIEEDLAKVCEERYIFAQKYLKGESLCLARQRTESLHMYTRFSRVLQADILGLGPQKGHFFWCAKREVVCTPDVVRYIVGLAVSS